MAFNIALQLYTVRDALQNDFLGGIKRVADLGFGYVEFAGFGGHSAEEITKTLRETGMKASGAHVPLLVFDDAAPTIEELHTIGCNQATIPSIPEEMRTSKQAWIDSAKKIEATVPVFADAGIGLGYHNHAFEWDAFDGFAALVENAPSANIQLDVFWAMVAGQDPIAWINRLSGRLPSIHCKDLGADGADIELGDGVLDFVQILQAADAAGTKTLVIEMDTPRMAPLDSAHRSLIGLRNVMQQLYD